VDQARTIHRQGLGQIESEPARPAGRRRQRIDRDQFEVETGTEAEQAIVGAHAGVAPARSQRHAQMPLQPRCAAIKIECSEHEMIGGNHRETQVLGFRCTWP
jgi:hypothetical protein